MPEYTSTESTLLLDQLRWAIAAWGGGLNELRRRSSVDKGLLSRFMNGHRGLTLTVASRICEALGLKLHDARGPVTEPPPDKRWVPRAERGKGRTAGAEGGGQRAKAAKRPPGRPGRSRGRPARSGLVPGPRCPP